MDRLTSCNSTELEAHGLHVGLPEGLMGNSEVGHLNIGAGRIVDQVSDGGVHSHIDHLFGLIAAAQHHKVPHCFVQFFGDGRDTSPTSGVTFLQSLLDYCKSLGYGELASVVGRYYAMDRDKRWERIKVAYDCLVGGVGERAAVASVVEVVKQRYSNDETDEFLKPIIVNDEGRIKDDDTLVFFDYRADRMREISETFGVERHFEPSVQHPANLHISCMTQYNKCFTFPLLFPPVSNVNVLAEWLSKKGLRQFHCAETEKYAHVTFFFNGGCEAAFENEDRAMIPSPKVPTYDHKPEMSCIEVAEKMAEVIRAKTYPFAMCNFAPPDMVGHTGVYEAAVVACEATDRAIGIIEDACKASNYVLMITADHGNAEKMYDDVGGKHTAHTCNKVPFISTGSRTFKSALPDRAAALCDVATTVLDEMGLDLPKEMTGVSLLNA